MQKNFKTRVVGVDISKERTTCAIVNLRGEIIAHCSFSTADYPSLGDYLAVLSEHILNMLDANGGYDTIRSVGIGSLSANYLTGCIENAINLPWKGTVPLAAMLRDRLGLAVALGNNAHVMALGEQLFGVAHGMKDFVMIHLGHGVGSCIYSNGYVHLGSDGFGGEIGHVCAVRGGRLCGCGNHGCLETYASAEGVVVTAQELMAESDAPSLLREQKYLSASVVTELCEQGDDMAIEVYRRTGHILGRVLANYASVLNPEAIIFTGNGTKAGHWLFDPVREAFNAHVFRNIEGKVKLVTSNLDERERIVLGASVLAWRVKEYSLFK